MLASLQHITVAYRAALAVLTALLLVACGGSGPSGMSTQQPAPGTPGSSSASAAMAASTPSKASSRHHFTSKDLGFRIDYPEGMAASTHFDSKYLASDSWKTYAPEGSTGTPVLRLTVPGSDNVTAGELRIGVSDAGKEVERCDEPTAHTGATDIGTATINGTRFATFHAADAGMSHYLKVHSYRAVHDGRCYAIDLLVTGTNPEVYDPPRTPPFSNKAAFARLQQALQRFRFTH